MKNNNIKDTITLYHGTTEERAKVLLTNGWEPNSSRGGANCGDPQLFYLTNVKENALWFAEQNGGDVVLELKDFPISNLRVDPHDGVGETLEEEINNKFGLPAYLVTNKSIDKNQFSCPILKQNKKHRRRI